MMYDKVLAGIVLPVKPAMKVDGASIEVLEPVAEETHVPAFFGGYAEDLLGDLGFDMVAEDAPAARMVKDL